MRELDANVLVETEYLGSNNSIVCTRDGLVLIDAPHRPTDAMRWRRIVQSCGDARYLINTDHHPDHTMCNCFLPGTIVSHRTTRRRLAANPPTRAYLDDLLATIDPDGLRYMDSYHQRLPTLTYDTAMTLELGGLTFELTHLPGHTPNNTLVYLKQQQIAFTGDLICEVGLPAFIEADVHACLAATRHIEAMDIRYIVPGHGQVCGLPELRRFRGWIEDLMGEITQEIGRGASRDQIVAEIAYPDRIHIAMGGSAGYPASLIDTFMKGSIAALHDQIIARRAA